MAQGNTGSSDSQIISGGSIPEGDGRPAYIMRRRNKLAIPVLIAVPHAGRDYPGSLLSRMRLAEEAAPRLEDRYVDLIAHKVAEATGAVLLVANAPRAMIDLNRAPDEMDWEMVAGTKGRPPRSRLAAGRRSRSGLGLVPRRLPGIGELWSQRLRAAELEARIEQVHAPYHTALSRMMESLRDRWGAALLVDMHSMPPLGPKSGSHGGADFVIGDRFGASCDSAIVSAALDHLEEAGQHAVHNRPYAGGYVLDRHGAPARNLSAMQLEICRAIYLDQPLREPTEGVDAVAQVLTSLVRRLADKVIGGAQGFAQAAQ